MQQLNSLNSNNSNARINRFSDGLFPSTFRPWNTFPSFVFPAAFNLPSFKRQVYHHLRDQVALFFFFLHIYYHSFFKCFSNLFYSCHCLPFPFIKGYRLEKGHIGPVLCSHSQKEKKKKKYLRPISESMILPECVELFDLWISVAQFLVGRLSLWNLSFSIVLNLSL